MKVETSFNVDALDFNTILDKVAKDVIVEIKSLVSQGKNTSNEGLMPKKNGVIPDFMSSGSMLNSITYRMVKNGFEIYVDDNKQSNIMYYINNIANWTIFMPSDYLDDFISQKLDEYLQEQFDEL